VTVAEGHHRRVIPGVGYGPEERRGWTPNITIVNFSGGRAFGWRPTRDTPRLGVRGRCASDLVTQLVHFLSSPQPVHHMGKSERRKSSGTSYDARVLQLDYYTRVGKATLTHREARRCLGSFSLTSERGQQHDRRQCPRPAEPDWRSDRDWARSEHGPSRGTLNAIGLRSPAHDRDNLLNTRRGYQVVFHTEQAGRFFPVRSATSRQQPTARHYLPIADAWSWRAATGRHRCRHEQRARQSAVFERSFSRRRDQPARMGRYESQSGRRIGYSAPAATSMVALSEEVRAVPRKVWARSCSLMRQVWAGQPNSSWAISGTTSARGSATRTPIGPIRLDLGYH